MPGSVFSSEQSTPVVAEYPSTFTHLGRKVVIVGKVIKIARLDADKYLYLDNPEAFICGIRLRDISIDIFTFLQRLPDSRPNFSFPMRWDNLAAIPITSFENWWTRQIDDKTRNMVRKANKKGIAVRRVALGDDLMNGIARIYNECPYRQGKPFVHYGKNVESVRNETSTYPDNSVILGAYFQSELVAFAKLTWDDTRTQAALMNLVAMLKHRDKAPTNALIAEAVRLCADSQTPYLVYESFPDNPRQLGYLGAFKRNNGFVRFELPRYYVPLTTMGQVAIHLGLHRRLADHCPDVFLRPLRSLRHSWYARKMRLFLNTSAHE